MIRLLMIPVGGTVAALVAIVLAHEPRGEALPPTPPPFRIPEQPRPPEPPAEDEASEAPREIQIEVGADGTFLDLESGDAFASVEEIQEQLGEVRHTLVLSNGEGVTEAQLDAVLAQLRDRFQVRKVYRALEAPPAEGR